MFEDGTWTTFNLQIARYKHMSWATSNKIILLGGSESPSTTETIDLTTLSTSKSNDESSIIENLMNQNTIYSSKDFDA